MRSLILTGDTRLNRRRLRDGPDQLANHPPRLRRAVSRDELADRALQRLIATRLLERPSADARVLEASPEA